MIEDDFPRSASTTGSARASGERFLLIRLSAVGDVINTLPTLSLLRRARPQAWIGFVVEDRAQDLLLGHPMVDHVHVFPRKRWREMLSRPARWPALMREVRSYREELRRAAYDVSLDVQGNLKGGLHAIVSGAPRRIGFARGYDREANHRISNEHVVPPADRPHRVDKFASLLGPLGIKGSDREWEFPPLGEADRAIERALFPSGPGESPERLVILHPGTSVAGASKRWPTSCFAALARWIGEEQGCRIVVTWGPGEEDMAREIEAAAAGAESGPPTRSLLELLALVRRASVFVSADTGPMHLAAACGVPCVALFGPKDPAVYAPWGSGHEVIHRPQGMDAITVDEVLEAVRRQLSRAGASGGTPPGLSLRSGF